MSQDKEKGKDQELKEKMRVQILIPIILGVLVTSAIISFVIYYSAPRWVEQVEDASLQLEGQNLKSLANSAGYVAQLLLQKVSNDMLVIDNLLSKTVDGTLELNPTVKSNASYFAGSREVSEYKESVMPLIPNFDYETNTSYLRTGWFVIGPSASVDAFNEDYSSVPTDYQSYYEKILATLSTMTTVYDPKIYSTIYGPYVRTVGSAFGLYFEYPLKAIYNQYVNYDLVKGETYFTFETRPYYLQITSSSVKSHIVQFLYPYKFIADFSLGYTACINTKIATNERMLTCIDYLPDTIQEFIEAAALQKNASYFIIEKASSKIIMFPNFTDLVDQSYPNITQAEFNQTTLTTQEAYDFDVNFQSFLKTYDQDSKFTMSYTKGGVEYILSLCIFEVKVSNDASVAAVEYAVGLTIPLTTLQTEFGALEQDVKKPIIIEIIILIVIIIALFLFAHIMIGWVSKIITAPIAKLSFLLREIENPNIVEEDDKEENKNRKLEIILRCIPNIESLSSELAELHKRFTLLKMSSQYTKEAETAVNDGDAIIKYSQALNIHKEVGNTYEIGIVYTNIANIHYRNGNYQEANRFYEQAINMSDQEFKDYEEFVHTGKKNSDESSVARVLKRSSSSNALSTDQLDKIKAEFEERHSNRLYYLAKTRLALSQKEGLSKQYPVANIRELLTRVVRYDQEGKRNPYRVILCLLDIAGTYLTSQSFTEADIKINEANERLKVYEDDTLQGYDDELAQDYKIPAVVLRQKYFCVEGKLCLKRGLKQKACLFFTKAIEHGKVYDPNIRQICLRHLEEIFAEQNLLERAPNIQKMMYTSSKKSKDIVLLLDYSQSMGEGKRINFAISNILKLFDKYIQQSDRISFVRYNMNCDIVFSLVEKRKNTKLLRKNIEDSHKPSGRTALYNAIYEGFKILNKAEPRNNARWIVALADGDDNESKIMYEQLERRLSRSDVNLIIIGLELRESVKPRLIDLCRATSSGLFIESTSNEDLSTAFQVLSDIIYGSNVSLEDVSISNF